MQVVDKRPRRYTPRAMHFAVISRLPRMRTALIAFAALAACASPPEAGPPVPRAVAPRLHTPGATFHYEGTLQRTLTRGTRGTKGIQKETARWRLEIRDMVISKSEDGSAEIAAYLRIEPMEGAESPFEGIIFGVHRPDGRVEPTGSQAAFHLAQPMLIFPRQGWFLDDLSGPATEWVAPDRVKLSNAISLNALFSWAASNDTEDPNRIHLERKWEVEECPATERVLPRRFTEEFWLDREDGHLTRYQRTWHADWARGGSADALEDVAIEIELREHGPAAAAPSSGILLQLRRIQLILNGFGSRAENRDATLNRIEEFRREFPSSPFPGVFEPIERFHGNLKRIERANPSAD